jgi:uncharacterized membrane protein
VAIERRADTSRLEGFSDAVFAFALTLLVVSLQVPSSYDELVRTLRSFVAFAPSFAALIWIWYLHRQFFRRFGLGDGPMIFLNALLLFVVLLYVYPLKFLATLVLGSLFDPTSVAAIESDQLSQLIVIYGLGYVAVFVVFTLMYVYALRKRQVLHLTRLDLFDARYAIEANVINIGTGLGSIALALLGAPPPVAGFFYFVLGPLRAVHGARSGRSRRALERAR